MNSKEALRTIGNTATKFIKSDGIGRPRIYYSIREMKKKEINIIKQDLDRLEKENQGVKEDNTRLWHSIEYANNEIAKLRKGFKLLKDKFEIVICKSDFPISELKYSIGFKINNNGVWAHIPQEDCELLEEVFNYE